jgi:copper chaperone
MKKVILVIEGMSCQHCVAAVNRAFESLDGIEDLKVKIGQAEFKVREGYDLGPVIGAIKNQGYAIGNIERDSG